LKAKYLVTMDKSSTARRRPKQRRCMRERVNHVRNNEQNLFEIATEPAPAVVSGGGKGGDRASDYGLSAGPMIL
jgi:hypothetical protein